MPDLSACPLCGAAGLIAVLDRRGVPVYQSALAHSREEALAAPRGDLRILCCQRCGFVFNATFDEALLTYDEAYACEQTGSTHFHRHLVDRASKLQAALPQDGLVLEIGCGKGELLRLLVRHDNQTRGVGFDPSYEGPLSELDGRLRFETRLFDGSDSAPGADVVVSRNVIEHIAAPSEFLAALRTGLGAHSARVFTETPDIDWILRGNNIWDFYYEHCSYFSLKSLAWAFRAAGFDVAGGELGFGGQYLWLDARSPGGTGEVSYDAGETPELARSYARNEANQLDLWRNRLQEVTTQHTVAVWGSGAKGVTFANLLDPDARTIRCLVDISEIKQGCFIPGTGHDVAAPATLRERGVTAVLVLNPNYTAEIRRTIESEGLNVECLEIED